MDLSKQNDFLGTKQYDVIIVGGSYAGLSAAMALGRSLRNVLVIDSGSPCNRQTPHSHNFITHDGHTPAHIAGIALEQVLAYKTITIKKGLAVAATKLETGGFEILTDDGGAFIASKLVFTTGMWDIIPAIAGFDECWGISVLHCPYCHGYEVRGLETGILANGDTAFELAKLISHWTNKLTVFTNGNSTMSMEQTAKLASKNIVIVSKEIEALEHENGRLKGIRFSDSSNHAIKAMYTRPAMKQHCDLPEKLGCELTESGHLKIDFFHKTTVKGVYAAGDNTNLFRTVAAAVAGGNFVGAVINKELIDENF